MSYESIWKDKGFESFEKNSKHFTVKTLPPFRDWVEKKYGSWEKFMKLKDNDKEKILLKYKHGLESDSVNLGLEITERKIMNELVTPDDILEGGHYYHRKLFNDYCYRISQEIRLIQGEEPPEVQKVREIFGDR